MTKGTDLDPILSQMDAISVADGNESDRFSDLGDTNFISESENICDRVHIIFAGIWILLIFTGLFGNGLVMFTIIKFNKLKNVTQCYLFNLAITDVSFIVSCVPLTAYSYLNQNWSLGNFVCKTYHYMSFVTVCATCLTLMMMTIDRYIYICNGNKYSWRNSIYVFYVACIIWIVSFILSIPNLITYNLQVEKYYEDKNSTFYQEYNEECIQKRDSFWSTFTQWYSMVVSYIIPATVLIISYIKILTFMSIRAKRLARLSAQNGRVSMNRKKTVTKTVILLTLTFIILWFPVHFLATWYRLDKGFPKHCGIYLVKMIAHTMTYANSSVNPIIYAFSNESVRLSLLNLFCKIKSKKSLACKEQTNKNQELSGLL